MLTIAANHTSTRPLVAYLIVTTQPSLLIDQLWPLDDFILGERKLILLLTILSVVKGGHSSPICKSYA